VKPCNADKVRDRELHFAEAQPCVRGRGREIPIVDCEVKHGAYGEGRGGRKKKRTNENKKKKNAKRRHTLTKRKTQRRVLLKRRWKT